MYFLSIQSLSCCQYLEGRINTYFKNNTLFLCQLNHFDSGASIFYGRYSNGFVPSSSPRGPCLHKGKFIYIKFCYAIPALPRASVAPTSFLPWLKEDVRQTSSSWSIDALLGAKKQTEMILVNPNYLLFMVYDPVPDKKKEINILTNQQYLEAGEEIGTRCLWYMVRQEERSACVCCVTDVLWMVPTFFIRWI
jgi:hypothetical protein